MDPLSLISRQRFVFSSEKQLQEQIASVLQAGGVEFAREVRLGKGDIIDFCVGDLGIEVKIKGSKRAIFRQLERYSEYPQIGKLALLSTVSMGLPPTLNDKPLHCVSLGRAWL